MSLREQVGNSQNRYVTHRTFLNDPLLGSNDDGDIDNL